MTLRLSRLKESTIKDNKHELLTDCNEAYSNLYRVIYEAAVSAVFWACGSIMDLGLKRVPRRDRSAVCLAESKGGRSRASRGISCHPTRSGPPSHPTGRLPLLLRLFHPPRILLVSTACWILHLLSGLLELNLQVISFLSIRVPQLQHGEGGPTHRRIAFPPDSPRRGAVHRPGFSSWLMLKIRIIFHPDDAVIVQLSCI